MKKLNVLSPKWLRKIIALFLVVAMIMTSLNFSSVATFATNTTHHFTGDGFEVQFNLISTWSNGYNAEVNLTNTSGQDIYNWALFVDQNLGLDTWGATPGSVYAQGSDYTIVSHQGWNNVLRDNETITFWLNGSHQGVTPAPTYFILTGDGFSSEVQYIPDNPTDDGGPSYFPDAPDWDSVPREPTFEMLTQFPNNVVTRGYLDIEYIATPSFGEEILKVYLSINGTPASYKYLAEGFRPIQLGVLGEARVFFMPGINNMVFTVLDSAGLVVHYEVPVPLYFDMGQWPAGEANTNDFIEFFPDNPLMWFFTNELLIFRHTGVSIDDVSAAVASIGGEVTGWSNVTGMTIVQVPVSTQEVLIGFADYLVRRFPNIISSANLSMGAEYVVGDDYEPWRQTRHRSQPSAIISENYPIAQSSFGFQPNDPWWNTSQEWGFSAIHMPLAWYVFGNQERSNIRVGIIDNGLQYNHYDLMVPGTNAINF